MQLGSSKDSLPCFTRLNPCVAHCSTDSIPWVHHSREEGSLDYDGGFVRLQIHMNFDTIIYRQHCCIALFGNAFVNVECSFPVFFLLLHILSATTPSVLHVCKPKVIFLLTKGGVK
jgi:hypothetical protein